MAGSDRDELPGLPSLKRVTRSLPQAKRASHGPCCDRSGREEIANLRAGRRRADSQQKRWPTGDLETYLAGRPTSRVVVETCAEAFCLADAARKLGHETRVVPATLVKTLGVGARRLRTDQRDARALSEVSCRIDLPSVHIPKTESRDRKTTCGMREALVGTRCGPSTDTAYPPTRSRILECDSPVDPVAHLHPRASLQTTREGTDLTLWGQPFILVQRRTGEGAKRPTVRPSATAGLAGVTQVAKVINVDSDFATIGRLIVGSAHLIECAESVEI